MALFKTTAEVQSFIPVSSTFKQTEFLPFIKQAERDYIIPEIGIEQYESLEGKYQAGTALSAAETALLEKLRFPIAHFAFMLWVPFGQVQTDSSGIRIVTDQYLKTAFQWQIEDLKGSAMKSGYSTLEDLLDFMEKKKTDYPIWTGSSVYTEFKKHFIKSAKEFQQYFNINSNRRTFKAMFPIMNRIELTLFKRMLGDDLYAEIMTELKEGSLSADNLVIVDLIKPSLANLTVSRAISELAVIIDENGIGIANNQKEFKEFTQAKAQLLSNLQAETLTDGNKFLKELEEILNEDEEDYDPGPITNDPDNGIGIF